MCTFKSKKVVITKLSWQDSSINSTWQTLSCSRKPCGKSKEDVLGEITSRTQEWVALAKPGVSVNYEKL